jgi:hypothetical protein
LFLVLTTAGLGRANYLLTLDLSPDAYTTTAGGEITLRGSFTTPDALTFAYANEVLFGLDATSPHLQILTGSVVFSQNLAIGFEDEFSGGGYLGPSLVKGPTTTPVTDLRMFVIPDGTLPGTYKYSYGVDLFPTTGGTGSILFDRSLTITVVATPEPSYGPLFLSGLVAIVALHRRWATPNFRN